MERLDQSEKTYWDQLWEGRKPEKYQGPSLEAHPLLARFLPKEKTFKFLEIGCVPGNFMVYFHKEFGYQVNGIDYSDAISLTHATCELNEVPAIIWKGDAFRANFPTCFDVVFSAGFVEHFDDWRHVLNLHLRWLRSGGYLIISVPNLRGIHKFFVKRLLPSYYAIHRLEIIESPYMLRDYVANNCEILYFGYWITWRPFYQLPKPLDFVSRATRKILRIADLDNLPNRFFSPFLWVIARKS